MCSQFEGIPHVVMYLCHSVSICFFYKGTQKETSKESSLSSLLHKKCQLSMQLSKSSEILTLFFTDYLLATVPKLNVVLVVHARRQ